MALAALFCGDAAAQVGRLELEISQESLMNLQSRLEGLVSVDAFGEQRASENRAVPLGAQRLPGWMLFGRLGVFNYQNELGRDPNDFNSFSFHRSGPKLGRFTIGIRRMLP